MLNTDGYLGSKEFTSYVTIWRHLNRFMDNEKTDTDRNNWSGNHAFLQTTKRMREAREKMKKKKK